MTPLVVDHDAGTNPDDSLALLFLLRHKAQPIAMTISGNNHPVERARYAHKLLSLGGRHDIPCFAGEATGQIAFHQEDSLSGYDYEPPTDYATALKSLCDMHDRVIYLAIQGLDNLHHFLLRYPEAAPKLSVVHMGLSLIPDDANFVAGGTNMTAAPLAAKAIYECLPLDLRAVGSHTTIHDDLRLAPPTDLYQALVHSPDPLCQHIVQFVTAFHASRGFWPALHDPLTASVAVGLPFVTFNQTSVAFRNDGQYKMHGQTCVQVSASADYHRFMAYFASLV